MKRKKPYQLKELILYFHPDKLSMNGGTIDTAIFKRPKLLEYAISFPKGFDFPVEFDEIIKSKDEETTIAISQKHSDKNEMIFTGLSSYFYSKFLSKNTIESRIDDFNSFRFQILMEQYSIISLVSVLETFIKSVQTDYNKKTIFHHYFEDINRVLESCKIKIDDLEFFKNDEIYSRTKEIIDYAFNLRNLYVHNGGIIDKHFSKKYKSKITKDNIGMLIRISPNDYYVIREWLSFFIQEVCRILEGYHDVWTDYLLSSGIILTDNKIKLVTDEGDEIIIPLQDGIKIIGRYEDDDSFVSAQNKHEISSKTHSFQLDVGKMIDTIESKKETK